MFLYLYTCLLGPLLVTVFWEVLETWEGGTYLEGHLAGICPGSYIGLVILSHILHSVCQKVDISPKHTPFSIVICSWDQAIVE